MTGVLVVGYGNSLRTDDGVGWHAAGLLATDPRLEGAQVLARHQLTPELAADISQASLVVLVDAATAGDPGSVSVRQIRPRPATPTTWSHHLDPETMAGLAETLYGAVPPIVLVSAAASSFAEGDRLSDTLQRALPEVVEVVAGVITGQHRPCHHPPAVPRIIPGGNVGEHPDDHQINPRLGISANGPGWSW